MITQAFALHVMMMSGTCQRFLALGPGSGYGGNECCLKSSCRFSLAEFQISIVITYRITNVLSCQCVAQAVLHIFAPPAFNCENWGPDHSSQDCVDIFIVAVTCRRDRGE